MKKRILFVDDEPEILNGLERMLRKFNKEWEMVFAGGGREALERFAEGPFDVIVTDMRMPGMDGAELLSEITRRYPGTIRMVLSGYSDLDTVMRVVSTAHRYLSKPCDAETLREVIEQAAVLRETINDERVREVVSRLDTVPSVPSLYAQITEALQAPGVSLREIGEIISKDVGMTAKVLQLVNSAFFGLRREITSVPQAVGLLGLETIRSLVFMVGVFRTFGHVRIPGFDLEALRMHMLTVGACAADLASYSGVSKAMVDASYLSGLLHDVGKLVLAAAMPEELEKILKRFNETKQPLYNVEHEMLHISHAEIGAYLMGMWGLPDDVVLAIAFHHEPGKSRIVQASPLLFTHVANTLSHIQEEEKANEAALDMAYIAKLGMEHRVTEWKQRCKVLMAEGVQV